MKKKRQIDYFTQIIGDDLKMLDGVPGNPDDTGFTDNLYKTMIYDAHRNDYKINDVQIPRKHGVSDKQLSATLKETLPNAQDQQFISKLINQRLWANVHIVSVQGMLENGTPLSELPGGKSLPSGPLGGTPLLVDAGIPSSFTVKVSADKKTAEVTSTMVEKLNYTDHKSIDGGDANYGGVKFTFTVKLNLSAHEHGQSVQDVRLGQEFIPSDQMKKA